MTTELSALLKATNVEKPLQEDVTKFQVYLAEHPDDVELLGNMALKMQAHLITEMFRLYHGYALATATHCATMREELGYVQSTRMERLLIDHIILCWLHLSKVEIAYSGAQKQEAAPARLLFWEKYLSANQRRFLKAIESLARVRRLLHLRAPVQVNIGDQQVISTR